MIRNSSPWFVQKLWDGIEQSDYCSSEFSTSFRSCIPLKKLKSFLQQKLNLSEETILAELRKVKADSLVVSKVVHNNGSRGNKKESELYAVPDQEEFPDRGQHDWYCFNCHLGDGSGCVVYCSTCPRIYHVKCLNVDLHTEYSKFTCPGCEILVRRPIVDRLNISQEDVNNFIINNSSKYSCSRLYELGIPWLNHADGRSWSKESGRDEAQNYWRYDRLIYSTMDLSVILEKAKEFRYASLEEYREDCNTLAHNVAVYFGSKTVTQCSQTGMFQEFLFHDIKEMQLCPDCFRHSNELKTDWFALPCSNPHEVVWAKFNGYPYWPAKVLEKDLSKGTYDVRFFGDEHSRAEVGSRNIKPIETSPSKLRIGRRTAAWKRAYEELQKFQQLASASQEQSISVNGRGSTLADGASFAFNHDELRGRDGIVKEENTITSSDRDLNDNNAGVTETEARPRKRRKSVTLDTPCPATTDQLTSGERNEDSTFPECTDRSDETVNGSIHDSPQSHKQQTECPAEETTEPGGAGQGLEPPLWDPSCPINLEELMDTNSNTSEVIPNQCEQSPPEKLARFGNPCTATEEAVANDERSGDVFTLETISEDEDPLALGSADDTPPSPKEKSGFCTEESNQKAVSGKRVLMWSSDTKDTRVAQLLEELQCCESIDVTDIAIICMILEKRKGCECAGCQDRKLRVCTCLPPK